MIKKVFLNSEMIEKQAQEDTIAFQKKIKKPISYPIDLDFFAESLWNTEVFYEDDFSSFDVDNDTVAFLSTKEGNKIVINLEKNKHEGRTNFSIAHEIGHISLHSSIGSYPFDCKIKETHPCKEFSSYIKETPERLIEWQANHYAINLLAPKTKLFEEIDDKRPLDLRIEAERIMKLFGISRKALELRLYKLGFKTINNIYKFT
jgi:Zn-dependent peptidase ImmA (M78 family)